MTITQASDRAIVNWQSFSIGDGNRVDIRQPDARSVLPNRVTGETTSTISGSLNANGPVFLINPNGIQTTPTGTVRAQRLSPRTRHPRENHDGAILRAGRERFSDPPRHPSRPRAGRRSRRLPTDSQQRAR